MKRFALFAIAALTTLVATVVFHVLPQAQSPRGQADPVPLVIPSLRDWHGVSGAFAPTSRIVQDTATGGQLVGSSWTPRVTSRWTSRTSWGALTDVFGVAAHGK